MAACVHSASACIAATKDSHSRLYLYHSSFCWRCSFFIFYFSFSTSLSRRVFLYLFACAKSSTHPALLPFFHYSSPHLVRISFSHIFWFFLRRYILHRPIPLVLSINVSATLRENKFSLSLSLSLSLSRKIWKIGWLVCSRKPQVRMCNGFISLRAPAGARLLLLSHDVYTRARELTVAKAIRNHSASSYSSLRITRTISIPWRFTQSIKLHGV